MAIAAARVQRDTTRLLRSVLGSIGPELTADQVQRLEPLAERLDRMNTVFKFYLNAWVLWGIVAVILLRGLMIAGGAALVAEAYWVLYLFAAFLIATGMKMFFAGDKPMDVANNPAVKFISRHMRVTRELHGQHFFVRIADPKSGRLVTAATPLFLALVVINLADLVFAVDSVPAIFAITTDTFIVYTSNVFAILGLRALYFVLADWCGKLRYLKPGLSAILGFIGIKMLIVDFIKIPSWISLLVIFFILLTAALSSWYVSRVEK